MILNHKNLIPLAMFMLLTGFLLQTDFVLAIGQQCCKNGPTPVSCTIPKEECLCADNCETSGGAITKAPGICVLKGQGEEFICPWTKYFNIDDLLKDIANWIFYFAVIILPLMIIVGGLMFTTSAGDAKRYSLGKSIMIWSAVGLTVILFSKAMYTIMKSILVG